MYMWYVRQWNQMILASISLFLRWKGGSWRWACHYYYCALHSCDQKADPIALRLNLHPHGHTPDQTLANVTRQCPGVIVPFCSQPDWVRGASSHSEQCVTLASVKPTLALAAVHWPPSPPHPHHHHHHPSFSSTLNVRWQRTEVGSAKASQYPWHKDRVERGAAPDKEADIDTAAALQTYSPDMIWRCSPALQQPCLLSPWLIRALFPPFFSAC